MSKFKFLFKVSLFSLLVTITTPTPAEAVKLVRQDGDQGHCQAFVPEGAYIQELVGKANSDKLSAEFGDTKSYLEGRNSKFYINNHNGNPIVENRVCGLTQIDDLPRVKGLLITTPEHFRGEMGGQFNDAGFFIEDLPILTNDKKINNRLFSYENDPINEDLLNSVIRDVIVLMRDKNQPVVDVYFPEQDITDGFIVALVSRAILDKVYVNGNDYYTEEEIKEHFTLRRGDYIWSDILAKDLRWINSNPYRQVDTIFKPGEKPRTSDVILETKDIFPFRIFGGYDNYGAPATSKDQYYAGFSYGDLWGLDHEVIYSIGMGNEFNRFNTHTLQYKIPFDWRHKLSITGTLSQSEPDLGTGPITQEGENIFVNLDYEIPLYGYGLRGFTQTLRIGFDYKRLENNVDFGGATVFTSSPEIAQFYWTYEAAKTSAIARNIFSTTLYAAPGDLTANNTAEDFDLARNGASEDYVYAKAAYETSYTERNTGVSLTGIFRGQYSINKLLSSEQIAISGPGAVRGFQTNSIRRDNGFIATGELATPYMSIFDDIIQTNIGDRIQGFVFYDRGWGKNDRDQGSIDSEINLDSYGVGMRFNIGRHLSGVLEYGREVDDELNDGIDDRLHLRVNAAY